VRSAPRVRAPSSVPSDEAMTTTRAFARLRLPDGTLADVGHGDLIGRTSGAALLLDDPRISEAHAIISLRRGDLFLLALRRLVAVDGAPISEVRLRAGVRIDLADGVAVTVVDVVTPARVLALRSAHLGTRLLAQVSSVTAGPPPRVVGRFVPGAPVHLWSVGDAWRLRTGEQPPRPVGPGDRFELDGVVFELFAVPIGELDHASTKADAALDAPLRVVAFYDTVELHRRGRPPVVIGGTGARILSELVVCAGPVAWDVLAREVWPGDSDVAVLRHRWDVALGRLRTRLREGGMRADLVRADRSGQLSLVLYDGDRVDDRT